MVEGNHYPWRVMSISRSKVSPSVYAYVIRKQNLVVIRLSNHNTAERGQENIIDIHTPKSIRTCIYRRNFT